MTERVLARGRASEILDLGDGRVLRRFPRGGEPAREAAVMEHARRHGYPVPRVHEVTAGAMVLQRVDGPTMAADLEQDPARLDEHGATLARLVILMTSAGEPGRELAAAFARHVDVRSGLADAVAYRLADRNVTADEAALVRALR
jgi:hypothetical protein